LLGVLELAIHLTERAVKAAEAMPGRKTYLFDDDCQEFALSISAAGARTSHAAIVSIPLFPVAPYWTRTQVESIMTISLS
jgi:hypothetical protein